MKKISKKKLSPQKPALFMDRDGVINKDFGYVYKVKDLIYEKKIFKIAKHYYDKNYLLIVISNQSGVGRKFFTKNSLEIFNNKIKKDFIKKKIPITDIFVCAHKPEDNCSCRKPKNLMIKKATRKWNLNLSKSIMIGDKKSDFLCAKKSKLKFYYKKSIDKKF